MGMSISIQQETERTTLSSHILCSRIVLSPRMDIQEYHVNEVLSLWVNASWPAVAAATFPAYRPVNHTAL